MNLRMGQARTCHVVYLTGLASDKRRYDDVRHVTDK
jgi:hypothetical protein